MVFVLVGEITDVESNFGIVVSKFAHSAAGFPFAYVIFSRIYLAANRRKT